VVSAVLR
jgi:hypothetical protein